MSYPLTHSITVISTTDNSDGTTTLDIEMDDGFVTWWESITSEKFSQQTFEPWLIHALTEYADAESSAADTIRA